MDQHPLIDQQGHVAGSAHKAGPASLGSNTRLRNLRYVSTSSCTDLGIDELHDVVLISAVAMAPIVPWLPAPPRRAVS